MNRLTLSLAGAAIVATALITTPAAAVQAAPYPNCDAAYADGRANIPKDDPDFAPNLDGKDKDGIGCEDPPAGFVARAPRASTSPTTAKKASPPTTTRKATGAVRATPRFTG